MDSSFVEQLSFMQESASIVEKQLAEENQIINNLKKQIDILQHQKIEELNIQIRKCEFETLKNETETSSHFQRVRQLAKEVDDLIYYRDKKLENMKDNKNSKDDKQVDEDAAATVPSSSSSSCSVCQELVECYNFLHKNNDDLDEDVNPPATIDDLQQLLLIMSMK